MLNSKMKKGGLNYLNARNSEGRQPLKKIILQALIQKKNYYTSHFPFVYSAFALPIEIMIERKITAV